MEVNAILTKPTPPPIEKIVIELTAAEAENVVRAINSARDMLHSMDKTFQRYAVAQDSASILARKIESAMMFPGG